MKTKSLIIFLLLINSLAFSQQYYIFEKGKKVFTELGLNEKIKIINRKFKEDSKKETHLSTFSYKIIDTYKRGDSIINIIRFDLKRESTRNEKIYSFENKLLPEFNLRTLKSKKVSSSDLKGKITFINLWFTNCFPCVKEIPLLHQLQKKYKNKVNFLAITRDPKQKVKEFLKRKDFKFKHLVNAKSYLKEQLGNRAYPKIIILDKQGVVRHIGDGIPSKYDFKKKKITDIDYTELAFIEKKLDELINKQ